MFKIGVFAIMGVVIKMNKESKKQLILSTGLLLMILLTLFLWYDNFVFHTYIKKVDFQYSFHGSNGDVMIEGYEFFQDSGNSYYGNGRILSTQNNFLLKGDKIECTITFVDATNEVYEYKHQYQVKSSDEVCYIDEKEDEKKDHNIDITSAKMQIAITRNKKKIYDESIHLIEDQLVTYNGSNKNYTITDVYVSQSWLKTGYFSSTIEDLSQQYDRYSIDYMCIDADGDIDDINNYERIAHITGDINSLLYNDNQDICFYDNEGSLLDKEIKCVITFEKDDQESPLSFIIDLHGTIKEGVINE